MQFEINAQLKKPVRVFRKVSTGVVDLGEYQVVGFVPAGVDDNIEEFGATFVRFVRLADPSGGVDGDGSGDGDGDGDGDTIPGYSTVQHKQGKENIFKKLAAADGATELVIVGDGEEEMAAATALATGEVYTVSTIDLRELGRPNTLDQFMAGIAHQIKQIEELPPL